MVTQCGVPSPGNSPITTQPPPDVTPSQTLPPSACFHPPSPSPSPTVSVDDSNVERMDRDRTIFQQETQRDLKHASHREPIESPTSTTPYSMLSLIPAGDGATLATSKPREEHPTTTVSTATWLGSASAAAIPSGSMASAAPSGAGRTVGPVCMDGDPIASPTPTPSGASDPISSFAGMSQGQQLDGTGGTGQQLNRAHALLLQQVTSRNSAAGTCLMLQQQQGFVFGDYEPSNTDIFKIDGKHYSSNWHRQDR